MVSWLEFSLAPFSVGMHWQLGKSWLPRITKSATPWPNPAKAIWRSTVAMLRICLGPGKPVSLTCSCASNLLCTEVVFALFCSSVKPYFVNRTEQKSVGAALVNGMHAKSLDSAGEKQTLNNNIFLNECSIWNVKKNFRIFLHENHVSLWNLWRRGSHRELTSASPPKALSDYMAVL